MVLGYNDYVIVDGVDATKSQSGGVWNTQSGTSFTMKNSTISYCGMSGGYTNTNPSIFKNCTFHHNGVGKFDHGMYTMAATQIIDSCLSYNNGGGGFDMNGGGYARYNVVHDNGYYYNWRQVASQRGAGINLSGATGRTLVAAYNSVYANYGEGIWVNPDAGTVNIYNNVIAETRAMGDYTGIGYVGQNAAGTCNIKNNIFYNQVVTYVADLSFFYHSGTITVDYNCYKNVNQNDNSFYWAGLGDPTLDFYLYPAGDWIIWHGLGFDAHGFYGDPLFVDAANHDYHLQVGSPCKDTGVNLGLTPDYFGGSVPYNTTTDIGAHEYR